MKRSTPDTSRLRREITQNHQEQGRKVEELLSERGPLVGGSYVLQRGQCGRPTCRCVRGEGHERAVLYVSAGGAHSSIYVPPPDRATVHERNERYRRFRKARTAIARLGQKALALADALEEQLVEPYPSPGTAKDQRRSRARSRKSKGGS